MISLCSVLCQNGIKLTTGVVIGSGIKGTILQTRSH